jgi:TonB family protein
VSAVSALAPALPTPQRSFRRHPISVPVDVIVLRSGIPDSLPGRCTDLSEAGVGVVVAGELTAGQHVALELRLPGIGVPVRARALVRFHEQLRCGLQFVGLSLEQLEMIRYWAYRAATPAIASDDKQEEVLPPAAPVVADSPTQERRTRRFLVRRRRFYALLTFMLSLVILGWWQWQKAWRDLETPEATVAATELEPSSPLRVSSQTMEEKIVHKVDPLYPATARLAGIQGLVVLDVVISADGTVDRVRAVAGPNLLAQSAQSAVQSWKFEPYRLGGKPVEVETTIAVDFRLD